MTKPLPIDDPAPGIGEAREKMQSGRSKRTLWILAGIGMVVGFFSAMLEGDGEGFLNGIPAAWAIASAAIFIAAISIGSWFYYRQMDEVARYTNLWAAAVTVNLYLIAYPIWYVLWRGELVREPSHEVIFLFVYVAYVAALGWKKWRG